MKIESIMSTYSQQDHTQENWTRVSGLPFDPTMTVADHVIAHREIGIQFPQLIMALGGLKKVYELPVLERTEPNVSYIDFLKPEDLTAPNMRGQMQQRPFIAFKFRYGAADPDPKTYVSVLHTRYTEDPSLWVDAGPLGDLLMGIGSFNTSCIKSAHKINVLMERLSRFAAGEPVGIHTAQNRSDPFPPRNGSAYVVDGRYERDPKSGCIQLWSPNQS